MTRHPNGALRAAERDTEDSRAVIGERLRRSRLWHGRSQRSLAKQIGVTQASLSNYELGKRDLPLSVAVGIASALQMSLDHLTSLELNTSAETPRDGRVQRVIRELEKRPALLNVVADLCTLTESPAMLSGRAPRSRRRSTN